MIEFYLFIVIIITVKHILVFKESSFFLSIPKLLLKFCFINYYNCNHEYFLYDFVFTFTFSYLSLFQI